MTIPTEQLPLFIHRDLETSQSVCRDKKFQLPYVMKIQTENITKYSEVKRQTDHDGQTELSNILVKKNVLNDIKKERTFTQGFKDCEKIKKKSISKFRRPSKLADKVNC